MIVTATEGLPHMEKLRELLNGMLDKEPDRRPTIEELLSIWLDFTGRSVPLMLWYIQMAFCKGPFFLPDLRIGLLRRIFEKIEAEVPERIREPLLVDLPLSMQKI